jgi:hypothetical protein
MHSEQVNIVIGNIFLDVRVPRVMESYSICGLQMISSRSVTAYYSIRGHPKLGQAFPLLGLW